MNVCNFIGNINNPELRYLPDSTPVLQFSFAANSGYGKNKNTTWLSCSLFGKRAETLAPMLNKGDRIGVSGELNNRKWNKDGVERYSLELRVNDITLLGARNDDKAPTSDYSAQGDSNPSAEYNDGVKDAFDNFDDNVPF
jgi:single-strand DNA-binding protein